MSHHDEVPRALSSVEQKVLSQYLSGSRRPDSDCLIAQIPYITVVMAHKSTLDLAVDATQAKASELENRGPLQPRMFALGPGGEIWGEVMVWVTDGYLSGMGLAWWNDDLPPSWNSVGASAYEWELPSES
jgi:hypothetical protein